MEQSFDNLYNRVLYTKNIMKTVTESKIPSVLGILSERLNARGVPYAIIGAMALGLYGFPRYTSDIDLITDSRSWDDISRVMAKLGYECFQKTDAFAQFDSEMGVLGKIDFMLVNSRDGRDIIARRIIVNDDLLGAQPVIQPTDYIILKLMAIANNPGRTISDEADIAAFLKLHAKQMVPEIFEALDVDRLKHFATRFGKEEMLEKHLNRGIKNEDNSPTL